MPIGTRLFCSKPPKINNPLESIPQSSSKGTSAVHSTIVSKTSEIKIGNMSVNIAKDAGMISLYFSSNILEIQIIFYMPNDMQNLSNQKLKVTFCLSLKKKFYNL